MSVSAPTYDELVDLTRRQARQIGELRAEVQRLQAELEQSRRAGKRQAAPFSKGPPKGQPKRPGRKPGHPPSHRPPPKPEQVDRTVAVPLPAACPECRAPLDDVAATVYDQYQVDLPEPKPIITRFRVPVARCPACSRRVQGRHPEQTSDALGAAAVQFGPRLLGFAADLKHRVGVPFRKCAAALTTLTGLTVSAAALVRGSQRLARRARPSYGALVRAARVSAVQHVDETGWKIGGRSAWLWVFADAHATLYRIRRSRGHEVVVEVLGADYGGVLVSDCFLAYDPLEFTKSKCAAHLLKRCSEVEQSTTRGAVRLARRVAALLRQAMALKRRRGTIGDRGYAMLRGKIHAELDRLLSGTYTEAENARLAKLLRKHRDSVLAFLDHDAVDATNNLAEREVRPAVLARKVSAGNRTEAGAEAHAVLASVLRTLSRQGRPILEGLTALLRHGRGHVLEFDHVPAPAAAPAL
jgi:transposase